MKKFALILFACLILGTGLFTGCQRTPEESPDEVILDKKMERGVGIMGTVSIEDLKEIHRYFRYMDTVASNVKPIWRLAQWGTKFNFRDTGVESKRGDSYVISDNTKEFVVNPKTGAYSLNADCTDEYPQPRIYGQEWLHLITEQNPSDISRVDEMAHIWADLDFTVTEAENLMGSDYVEGLHTALFQWVFIVKNVNPDSPDYKQYIWVNLPYYDYRYEFSAEDAFLDFGKEDKSDTFIYTADGASILEDQPVKVGERRRVVVDLIPYIQKALDTVTGLKENINAEHPVLMNTELSDLMIEQYYIGWEIPGTFKAGLDIHANSLRYVKL